MAVVNNIPSIIFSGSFASRVHGGEYGEEDCENENKVAGGLLASL